MKIIKAFIPLVMAMGLLLSCENEDWEFPDFDYTTTYFPYQYPVRTLVLGDYVFDNENDNQLKFLISPRVGGMYENKKDWIVDFRVNETLAQNLELSDGTPVQVLPQSYYTLNPVDKITIPSGEFHSGIEVQLTEEFLSDPLAASFNYVIPLEIVSSTTDSVLVGQTTLENADPRNPAHWNVVPKHFTLFGIKYVNPYHGKYLHRGVSVITDVNGDEVDRVVYRAPNVVNDEVWSLQTVSRSEVLVSAPLRSNAGSPGDLVMILAFDENNNCVITEAEGSDFAVTGSGKLVDDGDEWGGKKRDAIHVSFEVNDGMYTYTHTDTLVFRDKDVRFEEFSPSVVE